MTMGLGLDAEGAGFCRRALAPAADAAAPTAAGLERLEEGCLICLPSPVWPMTKGSCLGSDLGFLVYDAPMMNCKNHVLGNKGPQSNKPSPIKKATPCRSFVLFGRVEKREREI